MLEIWCANNPPDTFWRQTKRTFAAALRARAELRKHEAERDLFVGYHAGLFQRISPLKPFRHYLENMRAPQDASRGGAAVLSLMRELQAKGVPVSIQRLN